VESVDVGLLVLRVVVGVVFAMHGMQKLFGWFGGGGFEGTSKWFASLGFGDGRTATAMAGGSEVLGGLGLAAGLLTPLAGLAMVGTMTTAALVNNADNGFWSASKGWELNLYLMVIPVAVVVSGPGRWSVDHAIGLADLVPVPVAGAAVGAIVAGLGVAAGWTRWATRTA
jgi:putative oxidoreductase